MLNFSESVSLLAIILNLVPALEPAVQNSSNFFKLDRKEQTTHISPEIINELKDFENLIPAATIDEIAAKHLMFDGNFRTVMKYLRSDEFAQLQKQLLCVPEIIDVLVYLHLTAENATTMHTGATEMPTTGNGIVTSLDEYDEASASATDSYQGIDKMTNSIGSELIKPQTMAVNNMKEKETANNLKYPKRPQQQFYMNGNSNKNVGFDDDDGHEKSANGNSIAFSEQQPLVDIVLLEDLEVKAKTSNAIEQQQQHHHHHHHHKYKTQHYNSYPYSSLGTFTSFVEEVLQHLPNAAYQKMITDKCRNNSKFAQFYQALRSPIFKPYIEGLKLKPNIQDIVRTLNGHEVDVNGLEAIAFKVISWGPNL